MSDLFLGDCLEILPKIPSHSVDMVLSDLPYGLTECEWDLPIPLDLLWNEYKRLITPNGVIVLSASQPFTSLLVMSNLKWFRHEWIWIKNRGGNFALAKYRPLKEHESIIVFSPSGKYLYNPQRQARTGGGLQRVGYGFNPTNGSEHHSMTHPHPKNVTSDRLPSSWQKFNIEVGKHPTQKPVALGEYLIKTYTNEGMTILDNAMGSGSFIMAAINTNREYIGIEKEPKYYTIACDRISKLSEY